MITKILITALVIFAALLFIRHKNRHTQQLQQQQLAEQAADRRRAMTIAISLVTLTLVVSAGIYTWHWQQDHKIVTVRVINSHSGVMQRYQVYRADLDGRRFSTIDGVEIHLSDAERMEIIESGSSSSEPAAK